MVDNVGSIVEGDQPGAIFPVKLTDGYGNPINAKEDVVVEFTYTGTATNGSDYNGVETITILKGQSEASLSISALTDDNGEPIENVKAHIATATGGGFEEIEINQEHDSGNVNIIDEGSSSLFKSNELRVSISEEGLANGNPDSEGAQDSTDDAVATINISNSTNATFAFVTIDGEESGLFKYGEQIVWSKDSDQHLIGVVQVGNEEKQIIDLVLDSQTGNITTTLLESIDHPIANAEDAVTTSVMIQATDGTVTEERMLDITIEDDAPLSYKEGQIVTVVDHLGTDTQEVVSGSLRNFMGGDAEGGDIDHILYNGQTYIVQNGSINITTDHGGVLNVDFSTSERNFTYTMSSDDVARHDGNVDKFEVLYDDGDGDTVTGEFVMKIGDGTVSPLPNPTTDGDDVITWDENNTDIDGRDGYDIIKVEQGTSIDFSNLENVKNIEEIDISNVQDDHLSITLDNIMGITDNDNILKITGDDVDSVTLESSANWQQVSQADGYRQFTCVKDGQTVTLEVQDIVTVDFQ